MAAEKAGLMCIAPTMAMAQKLADAVFNRADCGPYESVILLIWKNLRPGVLDTGFDLHNVDVFITFGPLNVAQIRTLTAASNEAGSLNDLLFTTTEDEPDVEHNPA